MKIIRLFLLHSTKGTTTDDPASAGCWWVCWFWLSKLTFWLRHQNLTNVDISSSAWFLSRSYFTELWDTKRRTVCFDSLLQSFMDRIHSSVSYFGDPCMCAWLIKPPPRSLCGTRSLRTYHTHTSWLISASQLSRERSLHLKLDVTYCHVWSAACISGFGDGVHQLTADAKVTQLYVAVPVQEYVWRLNVCRESEERRVMKRQLKADSKTRKAPGVDSPLCIIFKFSFKWLSAFTVCKTQRRFSRSSGKFGFFIFEKWDTIVIKTYS